MTPSLIRTCARPGRKIWGVCAAAVLASALGGEPPRLINGDFEAKDEGGWAYLGRHDASHGVFSEPSRPGSHSYLLQLASNMPDGFGAITQVLSLEQGAVYRLCLDVWSSGASLPRGAHGRQSASLGDFTLFDRDLCAAAPDGGWTSYSLLFRAPDQHPPLQIRLTGRGLDREASTTAIDQVVVERVATALPTPLLPGKPLQPARPRKRLPLALGFTPSPPSLASLQEFRDRFQATPALACVRYAWHDAAAPPLWPGLTAWARHGVVPVISIPWYPEDLLDFPSEPAQERWRQFAAEARRWRYPLLLRLAPEMDLDFPDGQSAGFIRFWRAVHRIFQEESATNVRWFWTPSQLDAESLLFFPGEETVDMVGFTVRGTDHQGVLRRNLEEAGQRYPGKSIAVAASSGLSLSPATLLRSFPGLQFYTLGDLNAAMPAVGSPEAGAIAKALKDPSTCPELAQIEPPRIAGRVLRDGNRLTVVLSNQSAPGATSADLIRVEIWNGHPFLGGKPLHRFEGLAIRAGQRKTLRHALPGNAAQVHVLIHRAADPRFLAPHPDDLDWKTDPDLILLPVP